jgi:tetratricopeptide (TPR) repeat protein
MCPAGNEGADEPVVILEKKMIKRLVIIILVIFLFSFDLLPKNSTNARGADELFEFVKQKAGNESLNEIILTYIKFGYLDKAIPLIEKSGDKYNLLMYALNNIDSSLEKQLPKIRKMAFNLDSTYYKNYLLLELAIAYAKFGKTRESKKIFSGIRGAIEQEDDLYENVSRFIEPFGLISCLIEAGFTDDAEQLLYEKENSAKKFSDSYNFVSAFDFIVQRYYQLGKKEKMIDIVEKIGEMDFANGQVDPIIPQTLFEFGEILLKIEEFERSISDTF